MKFNTKSRQKNIIMSSLISVICNIFNLVLAFIYRIFFLRILSVAYLGINGLFTNILSILSLAELGVTSAIVYRFYKPIHEGDVYKVGQLMNFFKEIYTLIALVIIILGAVIFPFLDFFIKDQSEIPSDINFYLIYGLFVLRTVSTYICAYRQTLLAADQKQYKLSILNTGTNLFKYITGIFVLFLTKDYTLTIFGEIVITVILNYLISIYVKECYKEVFFVKESLSKNEKKEILVDTSATMLHKVGGTVLGSTDNIILSKFIGLSITGKFSNYSMVVSGVNSMVYQLFGSCTASLGNAAVSVSKEENYKLYKKLNFMNFWIAGMFTVSIYTLINDFICIWIGSDMLLDECVVTVLCIQIYLEMTRYISASYSTASGLFVKDRMRPVIEALINIVVSVAAVKRIGITGIFIGTIISHILTVGWREPYLLFRYTFGMKVWNYWKTFCVFTIPVLVVSIILKYLKGVVFNSSDVNNLSEWILCGIFCVVFYNIVMSAILFRAEEYKYYKKYIIDKAKNLFAHSRKKER